MTMLGTLLQTLRVWTGLADASESHLTPAFGWLLPPPAAARALRQAEGERLARLWKA